MKELKKEVTYTYIKQEDYDKGECNTKIYFPTLEQAKNVAKFERAKRKFDQPAHRPYYIVERVEYFTVCGAIGEVRGEE